jgi:hypothetical protein
MGFLSGITKSLFGGTDDSGQKAQQQSNERSQAYIEQQSGLARGNANDLYQQGDYARNLGINLAMALMGQSLPQQMGLYQQGNMQAQRQYQQGQSDYESGILGTPRQSANQWAYGSALPAQSSYQTQLPNFNQTWNVNQASGTTAQPMAQQAQVDPYAMLSQLLGGAQR